MAWAVWRSMLAVAVVLLALNMRTVVASLPPLLADVRADLGLSATVAGLLTTLPVVCFGAFAFLTPRLARRVPLERVLAACALLTGVSAGLRGVGTTAALFAGSLGAGVGVAIGQAALPVLIRTAHAARAGFLTGVFSGALPLGAMLAGFAAVPLADALGGWPASLAFWALPALLAAVVWAPAALREGTRMTGPPPRPLRREPLAWWLAAFMGVQSMAYYAGLAWLPEILQAEDYSDTAAGALQAIGSLVSITTAFAAPVLAARRESQGRLVAGIVAMAAAGVVGLLVLPEAAVLWVVLLGLGQGGSLGIGLVFPVLKAAEPSAVASLTAMTLGFGYLMASLGPWILGAAHDLAGGWTAPLISLLVITVAQLVPGLAASRARTVHTAR
jgi:CP family cyanate transporter-like MFS transporter